APDNSSASAGKGLASERKWKDLGAGAAALWGLCQGSGSEPYKTRIDLSGPSFKCTCPSRKFPCKHGLGLFLLYAENPKAFAMSDPPGWVGEWLADRQKREEKKAIKAGVKEEKAVDAQVQANRVARREERVSEGVEQLSLWLNDLMRQGLAHAQTQPGSFWSGVAARMVDAQAPGIARRIREMASIPHTGAGWHERLSRELGLTHLLAEGWKRIAHLDLPLREDIKSAIGFTRNKEDLASVDAIADAWAVLSHNIVDDLDGLKIQRIWLLGKNTRRYALLLNFAHRTSAGFDQTLRAGMIIRAEIVYFPSAYPLRAVVKEKQGADEPIKELGGLPMIGDALDGYADALARQPWIENFPMALARVIPMKVGEAWWLCDAKKLLMPLRIRDSMGWQMTAIGGGCPVDVFGEYDGYVFYPLSMTGGGSYVSLER
ncbi:SWIM zinc finger family protein, partial [Candidatus Sumerlaeota bacterium]|nr:SWIM zinc finger family protein [Candidatus Sumerlaeota bacterium]